MSELVSLIEVPSSEDDCISDSLPLGVAEFENEDTRSLDVALLDLDSDGSGSVKGQ